MQQQSTTSLSHTFSLSHLIVFCILASAEMNVAAGTSSSVHSSGAPQKGTSTDTVRIRSSSSEADRPLAIKVEAKIYDAVKAVQSLGMVDAKKLTDITSLQLIQHFDAASPPLNQRKSHGAAATVEGSAAKKVFLTNRPVHNHTIFGPYTTLNTGRYVVIYRIMAPKNTTGRLAYLDIASNTVTKASRNIESNELPARTWQTFAVPITVKNKLPRVEFRVWQAGHPLAFDRIYLFKVH